jgi:photosystem II stability/assembly factor-like uncharacterized protein
VTSWNHTGPVLPGGDILALRSCPGTEAGGSVWAGTAVGLYCSTDGGQHWQLASEQMAGFPVTSVAATCDHLAAETIFIGGAPGSVVYSFDGGETWEARQLEFSDTTATALAVSPAFAEDGTVLAGTLQDGVYRTTTRGRFWKPVNFGLQDLSIWDLTISPNWQIDETAFAIAGNRLFRSTNGARAWQPLAPHLEELGPQTVIVVSGFEQDVAILVGTVGHGIWRSLDGGESWSQTEDTVGMTINCLTHSTTYDGDSWLYAGTAQHGVVCSGDSGATWHRLGDSIRSTVVSLAAVSFDDTQHVLLAGVKDDGVLSLGLDRPSGPAVSDSRNWISTNGGLAARPATSLLAAAESATEQLLLVGGNSGLLVRSDDAGTSWHRIAPHLLNGSDIHCLAISPDDANDGVLLAGSSAGVFRSLDTGASWRKPSPQNGVGILSKITFSPTFARDGRVWGCTTDGRLARSPDAGQTWHVVDVPFSQQRVTAVAVSPRNSSKSTVFVATVVSAGRSTARAHLWRSEGTGRDWVQVWETENHARARELIMTVPSGSEGPESRRGVYMAIGAHVICPPGRGLKTWTQRELPEEVVHVLALAVVGAASGTPIIIVGTTRGTYLSWDEGATWLQPSAGPGRRPIVDLAISSTDRGVWVLAVGGDLWHLSFDGSE